MPQGLAIAVALLMMGGQGINDARRLYDAGKFPEVVSAAEQARENGRLQYLAAQSQEKLKNTPGARTMYQRLAASQDPAWAAIGQSGLARLDNRLDAAVQAARKAADAGGSLPEAQFEYGLVLLSRREYDGASAAFDKSLALDGMNAAAHYYGGLADYRAKRIDRMSAHFEAFLRLAPNAPERPEVESIMRTIRGK